MCRPTLGGMHPLLAPLVPSVGSDICLVSCSVWKQKRRSSFRGLVVGGNRTNAKEDSSRTEAISLCSIDPPACSLSLDVKEFALDLKTVQGSCMSIARACNKGEAMPPAFLAYFSAVVLSVKIRIVDPRHFGP